MILPSQALVDTNVGNVEKRVAFSADRGELLRRLQRRQN
jgi:hypothetical protein